MQLIPARGPHCPHTPLSLGPPHSILTLSQHPVNKNLLSIYFVLKSSARCLGIQSVMNNTDMALCIKLPSVSTQTLTYPHVLQDSAPKNNHVHWNCQLGNTQPMPGNFHTSSCFFLKTVIKVDIIIPIFQMKKLRLRVQILVQCHITNKYQSQDLPLSLIFSLSSPPPTTHTLQSATSPWTETPNSSMSPVPSPGLYLY